MVRRTIKNPKENGRKTLHEAQKIFLQNCRIKNLSPKTLKYYEENTGYLKGTADRMPFLAKNKEPETVWVSGSSFCVT